MSEKFVSREQVELLRERINLAEKTDASQKLYSYIEYCKHAKILIVGAGGSYPAAMFAKYCLNYVFYDSIVHTATPQTAINLIAHGCYDLVIGISFSGKTPDIYATAVAALYNECDFILVTGAKEEEVREFYKNDTRVHIVSYYNAKDNTGKERGMISMASTLIPCIIFDDWGTNKMIIENLLALSAGKDFVEKLDIASIANNIKRCPVIHVFYEWDTYATALDIESKFTESGVANVILHEKKNFSHGRYTLLYKQDFALLINLVRYSVISNYRNNYDTALAEFLQGLPLCEKKDAQYLEIGTHAVGERQWNIEALTTLPYLITSIGEALEIDISKPLKPFPDEPTKLYNYKGIF